MKEMLEDNRLLESNPSRIAMQDKRAREITLSEMAYGADMIAQEEQEMYETGDSEGYVDSCAHLVDSIASRVSD